MGRAEELGSGVLTTSRLMKEYAGKGNATFIEGVTFKTVIPLPGGKSIVASDTVNGPISDTIKQRLSMAVALLFERPGMKVNELTEKLEVSERTAKPDLEKIRDLFSSFDYTMCKSNVKYYFCIRLYKLLLNNKMGR